MYLKVAVIAVAYKVGDCEECIAVYVVFLAYIVDSAVAETERHHEPVEDRQQQAVVLDNIPDTVGGSISDGCLQHNVMMIAGVIIHGAKLRMIHESCHT